MQDFLECFPTSTINSISNKVVPFEKLTTSIVSLKKEIVEETEEKSFVKDGNTVIETLSKSDITVFLSQSEYEGN